MLCFWCRSSLDGKRYVLNDMDKSNEKAICFACIKLLQRVVDEDSALQRYYQSDLVRNILESG